MTQPEKTSAPHEFYVVTLTSLLALFCFRVLAQLLQYYTELPFLPPFDAWQSGAVPYRVLLVLQIIIIVFYGWILNRIATNQKQFSRRQGWLMFISGLVYFLVMAARLFIGVAGLSEHYWFHSYLPTLFHFVLSSFLMVAGRYYLQVSAKRS